MLYKPVQQPNRKERSHMKEDKRNRGFPNLDKYLKDRGRKLVNYEEGAEIYGIPHYSFVRLAKEAEATFTLRKTAVADIDVIEA
jgi:hypothetical protein